MQNPDLIQQMRERAEAVQAIVSIIETIKDACQYAVAITKKKRGRTVVAAGLKPDEQDYLKNECESSGLRLLEFPLRPHANEIHTSLTIVDGGVAETGTLVMDSTSEDVRIATMLAETHVAEVLADVFT